MIGRKLGMTQMFTENGEVIPVTLIQAGPCYVTQLKTEVEDGYSAIQVGYEVVPSRKLSKGEQGHLRESGAPLVRHLREFRVRAGEAYDLGQVLDVSL